jgi:hypothetical protein
VFDIHQSIYDEDGEKDEKREGEYVDGLLEEFKASPEAQPILDQYGDVGWVLNMLDFAFNHIGVNVPEMSVGDFNEILFGLFPRKVSVEPGEAGHIVAELRAFWSFVARQYGLRNARQILGTFTPDTARRLEKELGNPANYGMAKSFFMMGTQAGFDMTTQKGLDAAMHAYNAGLLGNGPGNGPPDFLDAEGDDWSDARPHVSHQQREKKRQARKKQRQARKRNRR